MVDKDMDINKTAQCQWCGVVNTSILVGFLIELTFTPNLETNTY